MLTATGHRAKSGRTYLTVLGDRQHGKTELMLRHAVSEARDVDATVLYECERSPITHDAFLRGVKMAERRPASVAKILRSNGDEQIEFAGGGRVLFATSGRGTGRGIDVDVHVIDGGNAEPHPTAARVVRGVLR